MCSAIDTCSRSQRLQEATNLCEEGQIISSFTDTWSLPQHALSVYHTGGKCQFYGPIPGCAV